MTQAYCPVKSGSLGSRGTTRLGRASANNLVNGDEHHVPNTTNHKEAYNVPGLCYRDTYIMALYLNADNVAGWPPQEA